MTMCGRGTTTCALSPGKGSRPGVPGDQGAMRCVPQEGRGMKKRLRALRCTYVWYYVIQPICLIFGKWPFSNEDS